MWLLVVEQKIGQRARAVSVLPTPVGPQKNERANGPLADLANQPARDRDGSHWPPTVTASSWPTTRACRRDLPSWTRLLTARPPAFFLTGMPVQLAPPWLSHVLFGLPLRLQASDLVSPVLIALQLRCQASAQLGAPSLGQDRRSCSSAARFQVAVDAGLSFGVKVLEAVDLLFERRECLAMSIFFALPLGTFMTV